LTGGTKVTDGSPMYSVDAMLVAYMYTCTGALVVNTRRVSDAWNTQANDVADTEVGSPESDGVKVKVAAVVDVILK
jgi:hypothetical protein